MVEEELSFHTHTHTSYTHPGPGQIQKKKIINNIFSYGPGNS